MINVVCVNWGTKYPRTYTERLYNMVKRNTTRDFNFYVLTDQHVYEEPIKTIELKAGMKGWWNKLQMFDKEVMPEGEWLYFDLDVVIYNKLPNLVREKFTLLDDTWWREPAHTPLNSSIVSWTGDVSHIWKKFKANDEEYLKKYNKGSDEFYYKEIDYETYKMVGRYGFEVVRGVCSPIVDHIYDEVPDPIFSICTLGQHHHLMEKGWTGWWSEYLIPH